MQCSPWQLTLSIKRQLFPVNPEHWLFQAQVPLVYVEYWLKHLLETLNNYPLKIQILLAIAVPLGLPNQEVFLSYNFEANYNSPAAPDYAHLGLADVEKVSYSTNLTNKI